MTRPSDVEALKQLALIGALEDHVELASSDFAGLLESSQQTASRRLIELTDQGFIRRELGMRRQRIAITDEGQDLLRQEHLLYQQLFEGREELQLTGTVASGMGEGQYYLSRPGYQSQFDSALGWVPFPGTLNLTLDNADANRLKFLRRNPVFMINGFEAEGRTFGGVTCHPATVNQTACAAILPHRSHYTTTLELIAPVCLRETLPCKDGESLSVVVKLHD